MKEKFYKLEDGIILLGTKVQRYYNFFYKKFNLF